MSARRARPTARFEGRNGASATRRPTTIDDVKSEIDELIRVIVEAIPPTPGGTGINPLAALVALEGARMTIRAQMDDALAGKPEELALFEEQLAKLMAMLRPLDASANAPGGDS